MNDIWQIVCGRSRRMNKDGAEMTSKKTKNDAIGDVRRNRAVFAENLRFLVSQFRSIAEASRNLSINRQQLNKYLNGSSFPSLMTLQKIASCFDIDPTALISDQGALHEMIGNHPKQNHTEFPGKLLKASQGMFNRMPDTADRLDYFLGDYLEYTRKSNSSDTLIASFSRVYRHNGIVFQKTLSPYQRIGDRRERMRLVKHDSVLVETGGLIHFLRATNIDTMIGSIGLKIINPVFGESPKYVRGFLLATEGVKSGLSSFFPVLMKKVPPGSSILSTVRKNCGPFAVNDERLDPIVAEAFGNRWQATSEDPADRMAERPAAANLHRKANIGAT